MALHWKDNNMPMKSEPVKKHIPQVLFKTSYGIISIIDPDSIKRFQQKSGCTVADGRIGIQTKAAIMRSLLDPSDSDALDKAIHIRAKRASSTSTQESIDLIERLVRESGSF